MPPPRPDSAAHPPHRPSAYARHPGLAADAPQHPRPGADAFHASYPGADAHRRHADAAGDEPVRPEVPEAVPPGPVRARAVSRLDAFAYRATDGLAVGRLRPHHRFPKGESVCLLTTRGRKSGRRRTVPLVFLRDGDRVVLVASAGGDPRNPMWFRNLLDDPRVVVQIGRSLHRMRARTATAAERADLWPRLTAYHPSFADDQARTDRTLPIVICTPT
jgi:deazaflavin-dependent oxidoreductase (nitroreductase family)